MPWLPEFLQGSLNSTNHIAGRLTEMEVCLQVASNYMRVKDIDTAAGTVTTLPHINIPPDFLPSHENI